MDENQAEDEFADYKEAFSLYDRETKYVIPTSKLGCIMRSLGQNPPADEIEMLEKEVDPDATGEMQYQKFEDMMVRRKANVNVEDELCDAFRAFDKEKNGFLSVGELRNIMKNFGDKLTDEELEEFIGEADKDGDGQVNYYDFVTELVKQGK